MRRHERVRALFSIRSVYALSCAVGYYQPVPERGSSTDGLADLLQELRLQQPGAKSPSEVNRAQTDLLLTRIASLTDTLRGAEWNDTSRAAARLLLADLAMVTAQFRGHSTAIGERLASTLKNLTAALAPTADGEPAAVP